MAEILLLRATHKQCTPPTTAASSSAVDDDQISTGKNPRSLAVTLPTLISRNRNKYDIIE